MLLSKSLFSTLFLSLCTIGVLSAQGLIDQGESFFKEGKLTEAMEVLDKQLETSWIEAELKAKGYYYRGMCQLSLSDEINTEEASKEDQETREKYLIASCYDFVRAGSSGTSWGALANKQLPVLYDTLAAIGYNYFDAAYADGNSPGEKARWAAKAKPFFDCLIAIKPSDYIGYGMRARAALEIMDAINACNDFEKAGQFYTGSLPEIPTPNIGDDYYMAASLQYIHLQEVEKALQTIQSGQELMISEQARLAGLQSEMDPEEWTELNQAFQNKWTDLEDLKQDLQFAQSNVSDTQLKAFEQALAADPENATIWAAYGQMLESSDPAKAIEAYKTSLGISKRVYDVNFRLAKLLIRLGDEKVRQAGAATDEKQANTLQKEADNYYEEALEWMDKAHLLKQKDKAALDALIMLSNTLEKEKLSQKYQALRDTL
ncbi:MAG: hypothetical protein KDC34_19445 [Saprospiraceae bacterium]|nr:hypothetical protein [Saprospiraceae bacterium]